MAKVKGGTRRHSADRVDREILLLNKLNRGESLAEKAADCLTKFFGTVSFLVANVILFVVWLTVNLGSFEGVLPFDPFPFELLTMIVSLEAIALSVIVLISQNRASKVADLREQIDVEIDLQSYRDLEKMMTILSSMDERLARLEKKSDQKDHSRGVRAF